MTDQKDILENIPKNRQDVPEGYFAYLQNRLSAIPQEHPASAGVPQVHSVSFRQRILPYVAAAACLLAVVAGGTFLLEKTAGPQGGEPVDNFYESLLLSDMLPITMGYDSVLTDDIYYSEDTDDDMIDYLINSGASLEQIEFMNDK